MDKEHLRVVSIQTDDEIKHEHAVSRVNWALRELAANLLRLLAGGGKEWMLPEQMVKSLNAISALAQITLPNDQVLTITGDGANWTGQKVATGDYSWNYYANWSGTFNLTLKDDAKSYQVSDNSLGLVEYYALAGNLIVIGYVSNLHELHQSYVGNASGSYTDKNYDTDRPRTFQVYDANTHKVVDQFTLNGGFVSQEGYDWVGIHYDANTAPWTQTGNESGTFVYENYSPQLKKVTTKFLEIEWAELRDIDGEESLRFLSVDPQNTHFGGWTYVGGTISILGSATESIASVVLQIVQDGKVVAEATLARDGVLGKQFGNTRIFSSSKDPKDPLFVLSKGEAAKIDTSINAGSLTFKIKATSDSGASDTLTLPDKAEVLVQFEGLDRFGKQRDEEVGGDNWIRPEVLHIAEYFEKHNGFKYNDASNMNGGTFEGHSLHQEGLSLDALVGGYFKTSKAGKPESVTKKGILKIVEAVIGSPYEDGIDRIFVTYKKNEVVKQTIKDAVSDGLIEKDLFKHAKGHVDHFHIEFDI